MIVLFSYQNLLCVTFDSTLPDVMVFFDLKTYGGKILLTILFRDMQEFLATDILNILNLTWLGSL